MATRTHARQMAVELLYAFAMGNERIFDFADELLGAKKIRNAQADFAKSLFSGVVAHLAQIDSIINANLKSWEISRLGVIDKCILRLGVYEILKGSYRNRQNFGRGKYGAICKWCFGRRSQGRI